MNSLHHFRDLVAECRQCCVIVRILEHTRLCRDEVRIGRHGRHLRETKYRSEVAQWPFRHFSFEVAAAFCHPLSQRGAQKFSEDSLRYIEVIKEGINAFVSTGSNVAAAHIFREQALSHVHECLSDAGEHISHLVGRHILWSHHGAGGGTHVEAGEVG